MSQNGLFDSNILVYADDHRFPEKRRIAEDLIAGHIDAGTIVLSVQVLQEYYSVMTRKLKADPEWLRRKIGLLAKEFVIRFDALDVLAAIDLHRSNGISFWDGLIVHAVRAGGAAILYTEDLQHDSTIAGVRIVNPFL